MPLCLAIEGTGQGLPRFRVYRISRDYLTPHKPNHGIGALGDSLIEIPLNKPSTKNPPISVITVDGE